MTKRGLVVRKCAGEYEPIEELFKRAKEDKSIFYEHSYCKLTPAGEALVQLFKVTGIFVEADAAVTKKYRQTSG